MNTISRKLHEIQKQSAIEEPTEARLFVDNDKEMQLHKTAQQILERHMQNLE
jgi:DNA-binding transcriptional regulator YhcF (GntR family)